MHYIPVASHQGKILFARSRTRNITLGRVSTNGPKSLDMMKFFSALSFIAATSSAYAGPFGIDMESFSPEKYRCEHMEDNSFTCGNIPIRHPEIKKYIIEYIPDVGVCSVRGVSKTIPDTTAGGRVRSAMANIASQLEEKYGELKLTDKLRKGAIWNEPRDWMMGILKLDRDYLYSKGLDEPVDGISAILLTAHAIDLHTSYWEITFATTKWIDCSSYAAEEPSGVF